MSKIISDEDTENLKAILQYVAEKPCTKQELKQKFVKPYTS
jgi:hypothetical protein